MTVPIRSERSRIAFIRSFLSAVPSDRIVLVLTVFLLPLLVLSVTRNLLIQEDWLDPYVYSGYIHDYRHVFEYFGPTYYSNRIAAIDLSRVAHWFFGIDRGYVIVRYILLMMASASIYAIARRFYGSTVAAVTAILLCFSPWYVRAIAWDYVDGFAITYLFVAFACLVAPRRHPVPFHLAAGLFFALAVNTNFFAVAVAGSFVPSWFILQGRSEARRTGGLIGAVVCGFVLAYLAMGTVLHAEFSERPLFFERATLNTLDQLLIRGESAQYFHPLLDFLAKRHNYIFVPASLCVAMLLLWIHTSRHRTTAHAPQYVAAAAVYMSVITGVYLINHFVLHHGRITLTYYFSYAVIGSFMAIVALIGEAASNVKGTRATGALLAAAGIYVAMYCVYPPDYQDTNFPLWIWGMTAIALPFSVFLASHSLVRLSIMLVSMVTMPVAFYNSVEDYTALHDRGNTMEQWDIYHSAIYLQHDLATVLDPEAGAVKFWYTVKLPRHSIFNSLQSTYLWDYSRVAGMPTLDDEAKRRLKETRYLVLLGTSTEEIDTALAALSRANVSYDVVHHSHFDSANWSFRLMIVDLGLPTQSRRLS